MMMFSRHATDKNI